LPKFGNLPTALVRAPCDHLPERAEALGLLNKALFNNKCDGEIERIQLHYLDAFNYLQETFA
jgi:hypothetical protein